jgi:hypothetical protein
MRSNLPFSFSKRAIIFILTLILVAVFAVPAVLVHADTVTSIGVTNGQTVYLLWDVGEEKVITVNWNEGNRTANVNVDGVVYLFTDRGNDLPMITAIPNTVEFYLTPVGDSRLLETNQGKGFSDSSYINQPSTGSSPTFSNPDCCPNFVAGIGEVVKWTGFADNKDRSLVVVNPTIPTVRIGFFGEDDMDPAVDVSSGMWGVSPVRFGATYLPDSGLVSLSVFEGQSLQYTGIFVDVSQYGAPATAPTPVPAPRPKPEPRTRKCTWDDGWQAILGDFCQVTY